MPIHAPIDAVSEVVRALPDDAVVDDVVRGRVEHSGSDERPWTYARCRHVQCVHATETIWVVIGDFVLVGGVSEPPVRGTLSVGPAGVYLRAECAECADRTRAPGPLREE